jgi:WXG100 family type VII secretion target
MSDFHVDLPGLSGMVDSMDQFDTWVEQMLAELDSEIERLHASWSGEAADEQKQAHELWKSGAAKMRLALAHLRVSGRNAHGNYSAAARTNLGFWA